MHTFPRSSARVRLPSLVPVILIALAVIAGSASAQVTTPARGDPLRAALLGAVRPMVEAEVGKPVEFVVNDIRVLGEWAFVALTPERPGGGAIEYVYSRYQSAIDGGTFVNRAYALLRQTPTGWLVYQYALGAGGTPWYGWWSAYPVPQEVFPPH
jgi:hypothetical protein